ncbi:MAG: class I SAM-dependent methyltransferase [Chloroflexota bacterium]
MTDEQPWKRFYTEQTDLYERLVSHEDYQGNLLAALQDICPLTDKRVVEFGAGTGRITAQLVPLVERVYAFDLTPQMVQVAARKRQQAKAATWLLGLADSRAMPLPAACADVAVEGWSFLQIRVWHGANWRAEVGRALDEMLRLLRPGGAAILIETLGTGATEPNPQPAFAEMYAYLEQERGFAARCIRTDYCFPSWAEAQAIVEPFFSEALETATQTEAGIVLPECTGIWWRFA